MIIISTKQAAKNEQHSHAHSLLSRCLKAYGIDYAAGTTPVVYGEHGKPALAEYPGLHYNISHADGVSAAMASGYECGIDCERIGKYRPRVMKRCCSEAEIHAVENAPAVERDLLFFSLWTLKEAYVKALGTGLTFPLREAAFSFRKNRILTDIKGCTFTRYIIGSEFVVSVCELTENGGENMSYELQTSGSDIIL